MREFILLAALSATLSGQSSTAWKLTWSDEFNGASQTPPDPAKWNYDLGGGGWGNGEAQTYTNSLDNAFQDGKGNLVIRAMRDSAGKYTSARLQSGAAGASTHTADLTFQYGRIEARMKLPFGRGVWPAFWMLGANFAAAGWPECGEIDIMENFGTFNNNVSTSNGTLHGPGYSGGSGIGKSYTLPLGQKVAGDYHVYAVEWARDSIEWFVDGHSFHKVTPASLPAGRQWVFNAPFFILLNLAIGGPSTFLGQPDANAPFAPQEMLVDYVRVYEAAPVAPATPVIAPGGVLNVASYLGTIAPGSLAAVFGTGLSDGSYPAAPDPNFPAALGGVAVTVNGAFAPLLYVSPAQVNFQVPWATLPGTVASVKVTRSGTESGAETITIAPAAPSVFLSEFTNGVAWVTGAGCERSMCAVHANGVYQLWGNGFGPKNAAQADGAPYPYAGSLVPLELPGGTGACRLTIDDVPATVTYCGGAPGLVIDQLNFVYPDGVTSGVPYVDAALTIGGVTGHFRLPAPASAGQRAAEVLARMTQSEKIQMVAGAGGSMNDWHPLPHGASGYIPGVPRLGIPDLYFCDGSTGLACSGRLPATVLPSSIASAAAWDLDLAYEFGKVIGAETAAHGINVNLGGNVNLDREPRNGRTFETKGEDPVLAGRITAAHVRGTQSQHVIGGMKHFALNDQETGRFTADVRIDERGARESDLLAFEIAMKDSNVQSVMCSYNLVNGVHACENPHLLNDILKGDWGFQGFVMSDWWATPGTVTAALAGLDQEQPNSVFFPALAQAVEAGQVPQARLDDMARRVLRAMFEVGLFDYPNTLTPADTSAGEAVAQRVAEQGAVLLKNNGVLPLNAAQISSIAVIGSEANIGVLEGGGSAQVYPTGGPALVEGYALWVPSSPLQAIKKKIPSATVVYDDGTNPDRAAALAASSGVVILFVSQFAAEGADVPLYFTDLIHSQPIDQNALVNAVAAANPRTIVVMENGGPQVMPWLYRVAAVLEAWYPGQRGGEAIANLLFGEVNPSGKLPVTFPGSAANLPRPVIDRPPDNTTPFPVNYTEGLLVGYKWYDANGLGPPFHFGFGLSYTTFAFSNLAIANNLAKDEASLVVAFDLANTGPVAGAEVAQVYLGLPAATGEPPRRLVGWKKVFLEPGTSQRVTVQVNRDDSSHPLSWWDTAANAWRVTPGEYTVFVGNSSASDDLNLTATLRVD